LRTPLLGRSAPLRETERASRSGQSGRGSSLSSCIGYNLAQAGAVLVQDCGARVPTDVHCSSCSTPRLGIILGASATLGYHCDTEDVQRTIVVEIGTGLVWLNSCFLLRLAHRLEVHCHWLRCAAPHRRDCSQTCQAQSSLHHVCVHVYCDATPQYIHTLP
jgi:hypothetical protein